MKHCTPQQSIDKTNQAVFAFNAKMLLTLTTQTHTFGNDVVREMSRLFIRKGDSHEGVHHPA
jgi:hypothetical protein